MTINRNNIIALAILVCSIVFFILGLIYPLVATKNQLLGFVLSQREIRLFDSIKIFYSDNEYFMASVILIFTFIFPIIKYADYFIKLFYKPVYNKWIKLALDYADKWSMLDVFIVAILIINYKLDSRIIVMTIESGTTFLAISIILRMIGGQMVRRKVL